MHTVVYKLFHKVFNLLGWILACCRELLVFQACFSFYLVLSILKGEIPTCVISFLQESNFSINLYVDNYRPISFTLGAVIEVTELFSLIAVWMTLTSFKVAVLWGIKKIQVLFTCSFTIGLDEIHLVATACWLIIKPMLKMFHMINRQGRELCLCVFMNYTLTLACIRTVVNRFISNLVWCWTRLNFEFEWP